MFYGKDKSELDRLHSLENQLLTSNDLKQFFEMVLATACDLLQSKGGYVAALNADGLELVVTTGRTRFHEETSQEEITDDLLQRVYETQLHTDLFSWGDDYLFPLLNGTPEKPELIGLLGISGAANRTLDEEQAQAMETLSERASLALQSRRIQQKIFLSLDALSTGVDLIQRLRAAGQYNRGSLLEDEEILPKDGDLAEWVKDALSHYWGGPKLTQNPMMRFKIVQNALEEHDGNNANALRAILAGSNRTYSSRGRKTFHSGVDPV